jgi:spore coat protein U-like protein
MRNSTLSMIASAVAALALASGAQAATRTTTFNVSATVASNCLVSATNLDFGAYTPGGGDRTVNSAVSVRCTNGTGFTVKLDDGAGTGTFTQRLLANGAATLQYNLYRDAAYAEVWGDGTGGTFTRTGTGTGVGAGNAQSLTVYGRVLDAGTNLTATAGTYTDTITVSVDY